MQTYLGQRDSGSEEDKNLKTQRQIIEELLSIEKSLLRNQRKKEAHRLREKQAQLEELRSKRKHDGDADYGEHDEVIYDIDDRLEIIRRDIDELPKR